MSYEIELKTKLTTLEELNKEAVEKYKYYSEEFDRWDNSEDLHLREGWARVSGWLNNKINALVATNS